MSWLKRGKFLVLLMASLALFVFMAASCSQGGETIERDKKAQDEVLSRAQDAEPPYQIQNFLSRQAINEWLRRMDTPNKLWYIYLRAESGAFIGYHICKTVPLSYGVSITNPARIADIGGEPDLVMPAPGLDGVFYTGVDPTLYFCFDSETDALILFALGNSTIYDKPLDADVPRLRLEVEVIK